MAKASVLHYGPDNQNVAWSWGDGPLVIFVHGWNGRAAQLAPLASTIAERGFRCVAIDVTGHGSSPQQHTDWDHFIEDIAALTQSLHQDVHAYVGHSAGALTMMAARGLKNIGASRYVCICAPSHPFPPIEVIRKKLSPRNSVLELYKNHIAKQFNDTWERLHSGRSFANTGPDLLLVYDEADRFVAHTEGDKIRALCPGARLIKTSVYGHMKILMSPELTQATGAFLNSELHPDSTESIPFQLA
jgi:pimeloyl-ACP methyl ester carboxylesterase